MRETQAIESKILSVIRRQKNYYKYKPILSSEFFGTEATRQIFSMIDEYFAIHDDTRLNLADLKYLVIKNIRDKELKKSCTKLVKGLRKYKSQDSKIIEETIKDFAQRQLVKKAILESLSLLDEPNPDFSTIHEHLGKAVNMSTETEEDYYSYFDDPEGRIKFEAKERKFPFLIPKLDKELVGGMVAGELCVWIGPPGRGKTTALINCGAAGLVQGLVVSHVTLEISDRKVARRYDSRLTGKSFKSLMKTPSKVNKRLNKLKKMGGELVIKDFGMTSPTVGDIKAHIINWQNRNKRKIDMLVVDYGDLIAPMGRKSKEKRHDDEEVFTDLRRLARQFKIPVYTASQATRKSLNSLIVKMEDVAESFGKVKVADVVLTLCQTPEEEEEDLIRVYIAKSRKQKGHPVIRLAFNSQKAFLGEYNKDGKSEYSFVRRIKKRK